MKEKICSGKRKLASGEVSGRKLVTVPKTNYRAKSSNVQPKARKEGIEASKPEEEGVTLKSEPVDVGT